MSVEVIRVRMSEFKVSSPPVLLKIFGLGSCVALALYDPEKKLGGLAHILLPGPYPRDNHGDRINPGPNRFKYADHAVKALVECMVEMGGRPERLIALVAGGATMFSAPEREEDCLPVKPGVGQRNVEAVRVELASLAIPVRAEDVGGTTGRTITFDSAIGQLLVTSCRGDKRTLSTQPGGKI